MNCRIDEFGRLEITYTNSTEKYAIQQWIINNELDGNQIRVVEIEEPKEV